MVSGSLCPEGKQTTLGFSEFQKGMPRGLSSPNESVSMLCLLGHQLLSNIKFPDLKFIDSHGIKISTTTNDVSAGIKSSRAHHTWEGWCGVTPGSLPAHLPKLHVSDAGAMWLCLSPWQVSDEQSGKTKPRRYISPSTPVPATGEGSKHWEALMSERFFFF